MEPDSMPTGAFGVDGSVRNNGRPPFTKLEGASALRDTNSD